jgi:uncharacterized protein (TIGR03435 family)
MKRACLLAFVTVLGVSPAGAQTPVKANAPLAFEVATVRPSGPEPPENRGIYPLPGGQTYVANGASLLLMIMTSYGIRENQIVGGADWVKTAPWDVRAKAEHPAGLDDLHEMFQTLLVDRFKLQFHRETKMETGLALMVDKPGKLKVNESPETLGASPFAGGRRFQLVGTRVSMPYLCRYFATRMQLPVFDKTGLPGFYDFTLEYLPEFSPGYVPPPGVEIPDLPNLYQALKDQLGLKLESQKGPVEMFVIDHVEKPAEN